MWQIGRNGDGGEVTLEKQLVEFSCTVDRFDKDDDLVEFESIDEVNQFPCLLFLFELDVILFQTMQSEFGTVVDVNFKRLFEKGFEKKLESENEMSTEPKCLFTLCINFLQIGRIASESVAENIITCFW